MDDNLDQTLGLLDIILRTLEADLHFVSGSWTGAIFGLGWSVDLLNTRSLAHS